MPGEGVRVVFCQKPCKRKPYCTVLCLLNGGSSRFLPGLLLVAGADLHFLDGLGL